MVRTVALCKVLEHGPRRRRSLSRRRLFFFNDCTVNGNLIVVVISSRIAPVSLHSLLKLPGSFLAPSSRRVQDIFDLLLGTVVGIFALLARSMR